MSQIYCLTIVKAYPDYKRPYASTCVYHFSTIHDANEKRRQEKAKYYEDFIEYLKDTENKEVKDIDELDEDEAQTDWIYADSYMDMEPFSATLHEIIIENDLIQSRRINFPANLIDTFKK